MYGTGPISLIFGLVVGAVYLVFQFNIMSSVNEVINTQMVGMETHEERMEEAITARAPEVTFAIIDVNERSVSRARASALLAPGSFTRERSAQVMTYVDPASLLEEGETLPSGELLQIMVEARGARLADEACERFLATVAADCGVRSFSAVWIPFEHEHDDEEEKARRAVFGGHFKLKTDVLFTPKAPVGDFPETARVTYNEKEFDFEPWTAPAPSPEAMAERFDYVAAAASRACDDIRAIHGNCVISSIEVDSRSRDEAKIKSGFELAWFSPRKDELLAEELPVE